MARRTNKQKAAERRANAGKPKKTIRSRVAAGVTKVASVVEGTPVEAIAPGAYQQVFRYAKLSVGEGGLGNINDIWATFLEDMELLQVPEETVSRLRSLGGEEVLNAKGFDKSVVAAVDDVTLKTMKESHRLAKGAVAGLTKGATGTGIKALDIDWQGMLDDFAKDPEFANPEGKRIIAELRKVDNNVVRKIGAKQTLSVLADRGDDPFWLKQFNKITKRQNTAVLPRGMQDMLKEASGGALPKIAKGSKAALKASGAAGAGLIGGLGRKAVGLLGKTKLGAGLGVLGLGFEAHRLATIGGRQGRADKQALQGFQETGPTSSLEFLRNETDIQEQISRRQVVLQQHEPQLFQDVVRLLGDNQQEGSLTSTERRIGSNAQEGAASRGRSEDDVKFLMQQFFSQVAGSRGQR